MKREEEKELLRISTAGSVDDGKSTLIGRLLYESKGVYEDQLAAVRTTRVEDAGSFDFALLTDGLRAEREQGITIDVAYRYFATPRRKFIVADTPGHEQYTRNMATGASTANLAIILVDARKGVLPQSRRHAFIASLLGIPHVVVTINKMDLVDFREDVFDEVRAAFTEFAAGLRLPDLHFIPISALDGDNVVEKSARMPWFGGDSLLHLLESIHIASDRNLAEMRFPVQCVVRPDQDFRGFAGQVVSGIIKPGETVMALPSGQTSRVKSIVTYEGELSRAYAPMSVTVCLEDEIDLSRGDMLVHPSYAPRSTRIIDSRIIWMSAAPLDLSRTYLLKHTTQLVKASVRGLRYRLDVNTLEKQPDTQLRLNDIGAVVLETQRPIFVDPYRRNRFTGSAILIDPLTNETVAACMITARQPMGESFQEGPSLLDRRVRYAHSAAVVSLPAGSEPTAAALERALFDRGCAVYAASCRRELMPELVRGLCSAGLIAIVTGHAAAELSPALEGVIQPGHLLAVDVAMLAGRPAAEQVQTIFLLLENTGVFASGASR